MQRLSVAGLLLAMASLFLPVKDVNAQTTLINPAAEGGFESGTTFAANGWTAANDGNNKWYVGTAAFCNGARAVYVDKNTTAGAAWSYGNATARVSHFYRDITFPAGQTYITLSFNFNGQGESVYDRVRVFLVPTTTTPVGGTLLTSGQVGNYYNLVSTCTAASIQLPASAAGTTQRLVFTWENDGSGGSNPPLLIDDISLVADVPPPPPSNDEPCAAIPLTVNASCTYSTYSTVAATASVGPPAPGCANYLGGDVWFQVIVPATGVVVLDANTGVIADGGMAVYSGALCSGLTLIACDDNASANGNMPAITLTGQAPGATLWIRFWEYGNDVSGTFQICASTFTPPANDNPCNATALTPTASCVYNTYTNANATPTAGVSNPTCSSYSGGDVWFTVTVPTSGHLIFDSNTGVMTDGGMAIYTGTCLGLTQIACDDNSSVNGAMPYLDLTSLVPGTTLFIRFWEYGNDNNGTFQLCVWAPAPPANDDPCNATVLGVNASCVYNSYSNVYATPTSAVPDPGCANYLGGDVWFKVTVPASGAIIFDSNTGVILDGGMAVYSGTCSALTLLACDDDASVNGSMPSITVTGQTPGATLWVRFWEYGNNNNGTFQLCAYAYTPPTPPVNDNPCNAIALTVNTTCNYATYSNLNATPTLAIPNPGCSTYAGGDVWFTTTIPASGLINIDANVGTMLDGAMAVYVGTCNSLVEVVCDDDASVNGAMPYLSISSLAPGTQIWIRFWEYGNDNNGTFQICVFNPCLTGAPINDLCTAAIPLTLGVPITGSNTCSGSAGEPGAATCWSSGALNTVWYSVVCPASGKLSFRSGLGTLTNTQIAVYSGSCVALTQIGCSDDITLCGSTQLWSQVILTGLTAGATYYVRVDGFGSISGDFTLTAIDGNNSWPIQFGQDCSNTIQVCSADMNVGNPGFIGSGNYCDFSAGSGCPNCLVSGERNSVWYSFSTNAAGQLSFVLTPNTTAVDYDFALWDVTGQASACSAISSAALQPVRCSYAYPTGNGATGMQSASGDNCESATGNGFVEPVNVVAGNSYLLLISNFSSSTFVGYKIAFGASPINFTTGNALTWTGGADDTWNNSVNWGGCGVPSCTQDAMIFGGPTNQPTIPAGASFVCKDMIIQPGASLTLSPTSILDICGSFTNYGNLIADPSSTIRFANAAVNQSLNGNLTTPTALGGVTVSKSGGLMEMKSNCDMKGNFTNSGAASTFVTNGFTHKLAGNFANSGTYDAGNGQLIFTGTAAQSYSNAGVINHVVMQHVGPGVSTSTNMTLGSTGILTLTSGKIITGGATEVILQNRSPLAVSSGNTTSYVQGLLRRYINTTGSYDFPVGHVDKGYQRANVNFAYAAAPTAIDQIQASFQSYASLPLALNVSACAFNFTSLPLNNGYWNFVPSNAASSGNFDMTLYNLNYSNAQVAWTIMSNASGSWALANGNCAPSVATAVARTGMNNLGASFGTTQSPGSLPVTYLQFVALPKAETIQLVWATGSEEENLGFYVERSDDGNNFIQLAFVPGHGTTNGVQQYEYLDASIREGHWYYYRLMQTDRNGEQHASEIVAAAIHETTPLMYVKPNPFVNKAELHYNAQADEVLRISLIDQVGKENVLMSQLPVDAGVWDIPIDLSNHHVSSGLYFLKIDNGQMVKYLRLVISSE